MSRTAFFGTPDFAVPSLDALAAGSELVAVVAQPDKPSGRGRELTPPSTALWARARGVRLLQPARAKAPEFLAELAALGLDLVVVAAYGKILPAALLAVPRLGCVNVHASLLPKFRGAAPIQWAIARGERETGVTLMQMDEGLDTGPMLAAESVPILPEDTGGSLSQKLSVVGGELLRAKLPELLAGTLPRSAQDSTRATLAPKLTRTDAVMDLSLPAMVLHDRVRAFQPWPGALLRLSDSQVIKVLRTSVVAGEGVAGTVLEAGHQSFRVATGQGALELLELQPEGKRRMAAVDFLAGHPMKVGTIIG